MMQFDCVYKCIQCLNVYLLLFKKQSKMTTFFFSTENTYMFASMVPERKSPNVSYRISFSTEEK